MLRPNGQEVEAEWLRGWGWNGKTKIVNKN